MLVCRACLHEVDESSYLYIDTFDNSEIPNAIPKDMLQLCVPEMDLYISSQPGICRSCHTMFQKFYDFKTKCLATEEKIMDYVEKHQLGSQFKLNLVCVVKDKNNEMSGQTSMDKILEETDGVVIKTESDAGTNDQHISMNEILGDTSSVLESLLLGSIEAKENVNNFTGQPETMTGTAAAFNTSAEDAAPAPPPQPPPILLNLQLSLPTAAPPPPPPPMPEQHPSGTANKNLLSCDRCTYVTLAHSQMVLHNRHAHKYKCPSCNYSTARKSRINSHLQKMHQVFTMSCEVCEFSTSHQIEMQHHKLTLHNIFEPVLEATPRTCDICEFTTDSEEALRRHKVARHGPPVHYCPHCTYCTRDKSNYRKHLYIHGTKPINCTSCNYQCVSPYQMAKHVKRYHSKSVTDSAKFHEGAA